MNTQILIMMVGKTALSADEDVFLVLGISVIAVFYRLPSLDLQDLARMALTILIRWRTPSL